MTDQRARADHATFTQRHPGQKHHICADCGKVLDGHRSNDEVVAILIRYRGPHQACTQTLVRATYNAAASRDPGEVPHHKPSLRAANNGNVWRDMNIIAQLSAHRAI